MKAQSFFIFHDEDTNAMSKQVMFGHINASNYMVTTDEFYNSLPQQLNKNKANKQLSNDDKTTAKKQKISFEMIYDPNTKTQHINITMRKLKFFLRPQVFDEITDFTIECLKKLDLKKEQEKSEKRKNGDGDEGEEGDPMNDSFLNPVKGTAEDKGNTMTVRFKLLDSILVLERREFQKKAAVLQLSIDVAMRQYDQRAIERQIAG